MIERKQVIVLVATKNYGDRTKTFISFIETKLNPVGSDIWYPVDASVMFQSIEDIMTFHGVAHNVTMIEPLDSDRLLVTYNTKNEYSNVSSVKGDRFVIERLGRKWFLDYVHTGQTGEKRVKRDFDWFSDLSRDVEELLGNED